MTGRLCVCGRVGAGALVRVSVWVSNVMIKIISSLSCFASLHHVTDGLKFSFSHHTIPGALEEVQFCCIVNIMKICR